MPFQSKALEARAPHLRYLIPLPWQDRARHLRFAEANALGLEVMAFCSGRALNDSTARRERLRGLKKDLRHWTAPLAYHGVFIDIALHSIDDAIAAASRRRIERDLATACDLGCQKITFHTGFNPHVPVPSYRDEVVERHTVFWGEALVRFPDIIICLENTYEPDASMLRTIMRNVASPRLRVCLDVAHAHVFGKEIPERWFAPLAPWIAHMHWNDNMGDIDNHLPIGDGLIHWPEVWKQTNDLRRALTITLELGSLGAVRRSLKHLQSLGMWTPTASAAH